MCLISLGIILSVFHGNSVFHPLSSFSLHQHLYQPFFLLQQFVFLLQQGLHHLHLLPQRSCLSSYHAHATCLHIVSAHRYTITCQAYHYLQVEIILEKPKRQFFIVVQNRCTRLIIKFNLNT